MKRNIVSRRLPELLDLFAARESVTSDEIGELLEFPDGAGADAITRCRAFGMEIRAVGFVNPSNRLRKRFQLFNRTEIEEMLGAAK